MRAVGVEHYRRHQYRIGQQLCKLHSLAAVGNGLEHKTLHIGRCCQHSRVDLAAHIARKHHDRMSVQLLLCVAVALRVVDYRYNLGRQRTLPPRQARCGQTAAGGLLGTAVDIEVACRLILDALHLLLALRLRLQNRQIVGSIKILTVPERTHRVVVLHTRIVVGKHYQYKHHSQRHNRYEVEYAQVRYYI